MAQKITIEKIYFKELKALSKVMISISPTLTAIMGVNGVGKTTVIHALACMFQPNDEGENYKFPDFFTPSSDSLWANSELTLYYKSETGNIERKYSKKQKDGHLDIVNALKRMFII